MPIAATASPFTGKLDVATAGGFGNGAGVGAGVGVGAGSGTGVGVGAGTTARKIGGTNLSQPSPLRARTANASRLPCWQPTQESPVFWAQLAEITSCVSPSPVGYSTPVLDLWIRAFLSPP